MFLALNIIGTLYLPRLTADIINNGIAVGNRDHVYTIMVRMLIVTLLTGVSAICATYFSAWVATAFAKETRIRLFGHIQALSFQDFKHFKASSLITRATNDIEQLQSAFSMVFEMILPAPFVVVVGMFLAFRSDSQMALIILIVSIVFIIVFGIVALWVFPAFIEVQKGIDKMNEKVSQYISGIRVIRAFNRTKLEQENLDGTFMKFAKINIRINRIFAAMMPIVILAMSLASVAIVWFGTRRVDSGDMQIGDITAVIEYAMNIMMFLVMAVFASIYIPRAKVCAGRVNEVLNHIPEIMDGKKQLNNSDKLHLEFSDVSFQYHDAENPVLNGLNFSCEQGTTTAIIGGTGSGKSTLARLIPRLLDVTSGSIKLNGVNIKELPQEKLRDMVGFVSQKAFLFSGTIADNLRHGNKNATAEDMEHAALISQSSEFINTLENKFESNVSQGGRNFSGGQRQRLSIARMLMKKPDIYLFDDSFSALDFKTDSALRKALKDVTNESIVITIAQRISTIKDAEQILVLEEGKIIGRGTHKELLQNCETYLEIAKSQFSEEELANEQ